MNKVYEELQSIQKKLVAKKDDFNKFGNYNYRTAEGILAEVKPLLKECVVIVDEKLELIGDRYYVVSTATLTDGETFVRATSRAREDESLKGMSSGQVSGATSSYAKKYALANLFAIDGEEKDLDALNDGTQTKSRIPQEEKKSLESITNTPKPKIVKSDAPKEEIKVSNTSVEVNQDKINEEIQLQAKYDSLVAQCNEVTDGKPFIDLSQANTINYIKKNASINDIKWLGLTTPEKTRLVDVLSHMIAKKIAAKRGITNAN